MPRSLWATRRSAPGISTRSRSWAPTGRTGSASPQNWRLETTCAQYDAAVDLARRIARTDDFELVSRARLTAGTPYALLPASHLHAGMSVPVCEGRTVDDDTLARVE